MHIQSERFITLRFFSKYSRVCYGVPFVSLWSPLYTITVLYQIQPAQFEYLRTPVTHIYNLYCSTYNHFNCFVLIYDIQICSHVSQLCHLLCSGTNFINVQTLVVVYDKNNMCLIIDDSQLCLGCFYCYFVFVVFFYVGVGVWEGVIVRQLSFILSYHKDT